MPPKHLLTFLIIALCIYGCKRKQPIDVLIYNGTIYTVDSSFSTVEAVAVKDGKIIATGTTKELQNNYGAKTNVDAQGKFVYPGWIDAHGHFLGYGQSLQQASLVGTQSWQEVIKRLTQFTKGRSADDSSWIVGNGWDQNDWPDSSFPNKTALDSLYPNQPVILSRIDGHAVIVNQKALDLAHIKLQDSIAGGEIQKIDGHLTGILIDNATSLVYSVIPEPTVAEITTALLAAQKNCFEAGLTSIQDPGENYRLIPLLDSLQKSNLLKMRLYVLLSDAPESYAYLFKTGKIKTDRLHVAGFKVFADGALGSRGACLKQPYSDQSGWYGFLLHPIAHYDSVARIIYQHGFQMATHAIGDSANKVILKIYAKYLKGKNNLRWRIEHAQVIDSADFNYFGKYQIIPSVQPTHATSDMYWAEQRLGAARLKYAYANHQLMEQNGWLPLGTDFPVEDISPVKTFYAAVTRRDAKGWPAEGFESQNALSRKDALRGMTIWAARAAFEENEKGSIEPGKWADFVITDRDLMKSAEKDLLKTRVLMTFVGGDKVYDRSGNSLLP